MILSSFQTQETSTGFQGLPKSWQGQTITTNPHNPKQDSHHPFSSFPNVPSHLLGRRHSPLHLIINIYIHFTFPNVPSHLLGRRHSPLHLIINIYIYIYIYIYSPHIPKCTFQIYLGEEKSIVRMEENLMTLMRGGWDGEGKEGIKREGGRKKGGVGVLLRIVGGWLWLFGLVMILGDLGNLWRFLGFERRKVSLSGFAHSSWGHTISGWTWARRAREPVEFSWARNLFPSWLGGKSVWVGEKERSAGAIRQRYHHQPPEQVFSMDHSC